MKKRVWIALVGIVLCVALAFGVESLLPHTYSQALNEVTGLVIDGEDDNPIYRLEGWDSAGEEYYEEYYEEYDEEEAYYEEEYTDPVYQLTLNLNQGASQVLLSSSGTEECEILVLTEDGETDYYIENTGSVQISIPVSDNVKTMTVQFSDSQRTIERIQILQKGGINGYRLMLLAVVFAALFLLFFLRPLIAEHLEYGFAITAIALLVLFIVLIPNLNSLWWDGDIHYQNAYSLGTIFEEFRLGKTLNEWLTEQGMSIPNYLVSGIGIFLGRLLNLSQEAKMILERSLSSLTYVAVCFLAIRWAKRYKRSLAAIALFPVSLFTAVSYSYDTSIYAFAILGTALIINELCTPNEKLSMKNAVLITVSIVMTSLPKAVYMPILLLMLLLPKTKFQNKKQHIGYKAGIVAMVLVVFAAYLLPMISSPEIYFDSRGSGESTGSQIGFILSNIPGYISMIVSVIWNQFYAQILTTSRGFLAYLGGPSTMMYVVTLLFMVYIFVTDNDAKAKADHLKPLHKWAMGIIAYGIIALVYTIFYITFTETGASNIQGVQGRYFIPLFPLLAAVIQPKGIINTMKKENDYFILLSFNLITTTVIIYQLILSVYYL